MTLGWYRCHGAVDLASAGRSLTRFRSGVAFSQTDAAMSETMAKMTIRPSGDMDRNFVAMMVAHHQEAIEMAPAELRYGS